jgi:hypothetical protein
MGRKTENSTYLNEISFSDKKDEFDSSLWRGVFAPQFERKVLFTKSLPITNLTKRKPKVYLSRRMMECADS